MAQMSEDDKYIDAHVHPILEKVGEALASVMPDDPEAFISAWLQNGGATDTNKYPANAGAKKAISLDDRRTYVQDRISPLLWQITYDCLTSGLGRE